MMRRCSPLGTSAMWKKSSDHPTILRRARIKTTFGRALLARCPTRPGPDCGSSSFVISLVIQKNSGQTLQLERIFTSKRLKGVRKLASNWKSESRWEMEKTAKKRCTNALLFFFRCLPLSSFQLFKKFQRRKKKKQEDLTSSLDNVHHFQTLQS